MAASAWLHVAAAALLVGLYVNTFEIWVRLTAALGPSRAALIPPAAAALSLVWVAALALRRLRAGPAPLWLPLLLALALVIGGLALPDARFPAKRIHVAQYLLLALVLRRGLAHDLAPRPLLAASAAAAALFGLHDEMIQGLHPERSFGWPDILVNGLGAAAGAGIGHGLHLFRDPAADGGWRRAALLPAVLVAALAVYPVLLALTGWPFR